MPPTLCRQYSLTSGDTLLHIAAKQEDCEIGVLDKLVELGADLDWQNAEGLTPEEAASEKSYAGIAEHLRPKQPRIAS